MGPRVAIRGAIQHNKSEIPPAPALQGLFPAFSKRFSMIERYSDHAANERTFLAWVRTGIATIAFGFVVEKFNLFVRTIVEANMSDAVARLRLNRFSDSFSHYDGIVLIFFGMLIIVLSLVRFIRTSRMIDDQESHSAGGIRAELVLAVVLALIVMSMVTYFALF